MNLLSTFLQSYYWAYIKFLFKGRNRNILINFYRKKGMIIGDNCRIFSTISTPEPYLIDIGNNVTIAPGVRLITHDNSVCKILPNVTDVFGKISIKNNCFIGANATILLGVTIGENSIVAAGSVVTKSCPKNQVIGGNPAKPICTIDEYREKIQSYCISTKDLNKQQKKELILGQTRLIVK